VSELYSIYKYAYGNKYTCSLPPSPNNVDNFFADERVRERKIVKPSLIERINNEKALKL
jgi:hypothetical protein